VLLPEVAAEVSFKYGTKLAASTVTAIHYFWEYLDRLVPTSTDHALCLIAPGSTAVSSWHEGQIVCRSILYAAEHLVPSACPFCNVRCLPSQASIRDMSK
jgi:hypothetical protein